METEHHSEILKQMMERMTNRPWYEKLWARIYHSYHDVVMLYKHVTMEQYYAKIAKDEIALNIKDDIEFGYDLEMIYTKIMSGSYGNEKVSPDENYYGTTYDWGGHHQRLASNINRNGYKGIGL